MMSAMQMTMLFTKMFAIDAEATKCEMTMILYRAV
jgi:hypothetical protein